MNERQQTHVDMLPEDLLLRPFAWETAKEVVGEKFQVLPEDGDAVAVELVDVTAVKPGRYRQFSAIFRGPASAFLAQRTYRFRHERLGDFAFLITAIARSADTIDYEACFAHES